MSDIEDTRNIQDHAELIKINHESQPTALNKALQIIFDNMQYNFKKIRDRLHNNTSDINATTMALQYQIEKIHNIENVIEKINIEIIEEKLKEARSYRKYIASLVGLGGLGSFIILLQIIDIIFTK